MLSLLPPFLHPFVPMTVEIWAKWSLATGKGKGLFPRLVKFLRNDMLRIFSQHFYNKS